MSDIGIYKFDPQINIDVDRETGLYTGTFRYQGMEQQVSSFSKSEVIKQLENIAQNEYKHFARSIGMDRSRGMGGSSLGDVEINSRERLLIKEHAAAPVIGGLMKSFETLHLLKAALIGNFDDLVAGILIAIGLKKAKYFAYVGGEKVFGKNPRALRKAVTNKKNRNIQTIMHNVRSHLQEKEKILEATKRIRKKRMQAVNLGDISWKKRELRLRTNRMKLEVCKAHKLELRSKEKSMDLF